MRSEATETFKRFTAAQAISLDRAEFSWRARTGPLGLISVEDSLHRGTPILRVTALGFLPLARPKADATMLKSERMRYLAELAWAPHALLRNTALDWSVVGDRALTVGLGSGRSRGEVELRLDEAGLIAETFAPDRPRIEDGRTVERPWHGRFDNYRSFAGVMVPTRAEVGWTVGDRLFSVWRGEILDWRLA